MSNNTIYNYKAKITRVVDADTVDAEIDCGFGIIISKRIRLLNYDAPETWRPSCEEEYTHGLKATEKAKELLEGKVLYIETGKDKGVYGRYLANIQMEDGNDFVEYMKSNGFSKLDKY